MAAQIKIIISQTGSGTAIKDAQRDIEHLARTARSSGGSFNAFREMITGAFRSVGDAAARYLGMAVREVGQFLTDSVSSAGDFQQSLSVLQSVSDATEQQMQTLKNTAMDLGNDLSLPATSAQDASQAMLALAKAGLSVDDVLGAAKGTLQLAAAAETDAAVAAEITAAALNAFGLAGTEAVKIADLLAGAANSSSANMTDLSQGLQQAGFAFNAAGFKVEDLAASLAILTKNGLTGSDAGTALKNAIMRMMNPTKQAKDMMDALGISFYDARGNMRPLEEIIGILQKSLKGLTNAERDEALSTIFLGDGMKALLPLLDAGATGFESMRDEVSKAGSANKVASAQMSGWNGAVAAVTNALDTLKLTIGDALLPILTPLALRVGELISNLSVFAREIFAAEDPMQALIEAMNGVLPGFSVFVDTLKDVWQSIQPIVDIIANNLEPILVGIGVVAGGLAVGAIATLVGSFLSLAAPIAAVVAAVALLYNAWQSDFGGIRTATMELWESSLKPALTQLAAWLGENIPIAIEKAAQFWETTLKPALETVATFIAENVIPVLGTIITKVSEDMPKGIQLLSDFWNNTLYPALEKTWGFINNSIVPLLVSLADTYLAGVNKATEVLAGIWQNVLWPALQDVYTWINATLVPLFNATLKPAIDALITKTGDLTGGWKGIGKAIQDTIGFLRDLTTKINAFKVPDWVYKLINATGSAFSPASVINDVVGGARKIGGFALGVRNFSGGLAMVGEQGPELVSLPRGSNVYTNQETQQIMRGGGNGSNVVVNIHNPTVDSGQRLTELSMQIRREVMAVLNNEVANLALEGVA